MGGELGPHLHVEGTSVVHRLPAHTKLVGLVVFVLLVVALPRGAHGHRVVMLAVALAVVAATRVPWRHVLPRLAVETPLHARRDPPRGGGAAEKHQLHIPKDPDIRLARLKALVAPVVSEQLHGLVHEAHGIFERRFRFAFEKHPTPLGGIGHQRRWWPGS